MKSVFLSQNSKSGLGYILGILSTIQRNKILDLTLDFTDIAGAKDKLPCHSCRKNEMREMPSQPFAFASGTPGNGVDLDQPESKISTYISNHIYTLKT